MSAGNVVSPIRNAASNRTHLAHEADQPLGRAFRRFGPIAVPGTPWQAWLGFTTSASMTDNTTECPAALVGTTAACARQRFHEIGVGQVPAGPREGPAPNPDPNAPNNAWGKLAGSPLTVQLLGRPATMVPNAWKTAPDDQAAMTIVSLRNDFENAQRSLDARIRPTTLGTPWGVAMAFASFSAGGGGTARAFNRFAPELASVPEAQRWSALLALLDRKMRDGTLPPGAPEHPNPYYTAMRTWQKLENARVLAQSTGGSAADVAFFSDNLPNQGDVIASVLAGANGQHPGVATNLVTREQQAAGATAVAGGSAAWIAAATGVLAFLKRDEIADAIRKVFRR